MTTENIQLRARDQARRINVRRRWPHLVAAVVGVIALGWVLSYAQT